MKLLNWFTHHRRPAARRTRQLACQPLEPRQLMTVATLGAETLVNDLVLRTQTTGGETAVAVSSANQVVVFSGHGTGDESGVYAKVFDADGVVIKSQFLVNTTVRGDQHTAAVASDSDGNFVVTWAGRGAGDSSGIFMQRFTAAGETVGVETRVNTTIAGMQVDPAVAMDADGSFTVGWSGQSEGDSSGVYLQRFDASGVAVGGQVLVNTTTSDHQEGIALAYDTQSNLIASWSSLGQDTSHWGVFGQRYNSDGGVLGSEFAWNTTTVDCQMDVALAAGPDGEVVAAWQTHSQDGDGWGVAARRMDADGTTFGDEVLLNEITVGQQQDVKIAIADDGQWIATWSTAVANGAGWEVLARTFDSDGTPETDSIAVNQVMAGANSGHQRYSSVATVGERAVIVWSGKGESDRNGVQMQRYDVELIDQGPQQAPNLEEISDGTMTLGTQLVVNVTASDPNSRDTLTFLLDTDNSPASATLEQLDNGSAVIRWTPTAADEGGTFMFRVLVVDDGDPSLADSEEFEITVANVALSLDLNGDQVPGTDLSATFAADGGAVGLTDEAITIAGAEGGMVMSASVVLNETPNGNAESLAVDVLDTAITASYDSATRTLSLAGTDTADNYERVLRTLQYDNTDANAAGTRSVAITLADSLESSNTPIVETTIGSVDLARFALAITDAGATFFGAAWCPFCTEQKELFEDGGQFLPFEEVTNADRTLNQVGIDNNISSLPTWVFADGTRLEGPQSLQVLGAAAGITIPVSNTPFLAEIADDGLLVGSPLHIPLDGYDPNGAPLSYTVTTDNAGVTAELLTGNRSMRVDVAGFGDMVFELFEGRASRATDRVIELAMEDFYDGLTFHRVLDNFVIQGGDPAGDGTGGSDKGDFDDQFHVDLQHNRSGLLSYAKGGDDTNDSQFFITEGDSASLRNLDFNHTIFGVLTEGESNRDAVSNTAVTAQSATNSEVSRPAIDVVIEDVEIFNDTENATLLLKAADGVTGPVEVTVTVTNQAGNSFERKFTVQVADDTVNGRPFLGDIAPVSITSGTSAQIQLTSTDVEGDAVVYEAGQVGTVNYTFDITDDGLLTVTPPDGFTGSMDIAVLVRRETPTSSSDFDRQIITINVGNP